MSLSNTVPWISRSPYSSPTDISVYSSSMPSHGVPAQQLWISVMRLLQPTSFEHLPLAISGPMFFATSLIHSSFNMVQLYPSANSSRSTQECKSRWCSINCASIMSFSPQQSNWLATIKAWVSSNFSAVSMKDESPAYTNRSIQLKYFGLIRGNSMTHCRLLLSSSSSTSSSMISSSLSLLMSAFGGSGDRSTGTSSGPSEVATTPSR
mmetsp:Transcript_5995/g.16285  ORF Transcript_5995/g.16285 Transcript_5995/m.16285 type:complete len:208 (-) Transcript_5995:894-1517(-)